MNSAQKRAIETLALNKPKGRRMSGPSREFVEVSVWDEKIGGVLSPDKVVSEDFGEGHKEGCWVLRGRKGVHSEENYTDQQMCETRVEGGDSGFLLGRVV